MARPSKQGLDYFPFDVDFDTNAKTEAVMGEFGAKGVLSMIYLLSAVYQNGYYLRWDKLKQMQLANRVSGSTPELVNQIVNRLIDYGTFDKELFDSAKVLTSQRIQSTYLDATKRRKQPKQTLYWINDDNNHRSSVVNVDINPQSKVKESKVNNNNVQTQNEPKKQPSHDGHSLADDFEKLWKLYPSKKGKKKAFDAYKRAIKKGTTNKEIQNGIVDLIKHQDSKYYPNGSTWFNGERWTDSYETPEPQVLNEIKAEKPKPKSKWQIFWDIYYDHGSELDKAIPAIQDKYPGITPDEIDRVMNPDKYKAKEGNW
ncbi:DUF4373 domain-containing protein [Lentilactobacillus parabuchneri]|uniref:DUF4373 domain-containing protein n=1 Tax=Lentilactobacillus parabuchneri TaxID=152331 RepID=UPI0023075768|nr:DUF4373 domain-containing protein [Lentilactobacillus parabuchneri]MDB1104772.1 DUF4373 domain-containing protein [Lentilactobacillus parabuchneri]